MFNGWDGGREPFSTISKKEVREKDNEMKRYEYQVYYLKIETEESKEQQLLETLNRFGSEGWRLNRLYQEVSLRSIMSWKGGLNLLLEREITE